MRLKNICWLFITIIVCFVVPLVTSAQIRITEIMFDVEGTDTGREWIEVYNEGSASVDLSTWKLFEGNVAHKLTALGEAVLPPQGYAILSDVPAKFLEDHTGFSGLVLDSVFSLGNEGETLVMRNESGADIDTVSYTGDMGAKGDGKSLQKTSVGSWIAATQTPGLATTHTQSDSVPPPTTSSDLNDASPLPTTKNPDPNSTHSSQTVANISFDAPELVVTSGRPRIGFVGTPLAFEAKISSMKNIPMGNAVANTWTWGDGFVSSGQFVSHTYEYPGDYIVVLNSSMGGASAVSKVKIKIISPQVSITSADASSIEISNTDGNELNIGGWSLETAGDRKVFPQDTIISPHSRIRMPTRALGLRSVSGYARLMNPSSVVLSQKNLSEPMVLLPNGMTESEFVDKLIQELKK